MWGEKAAGLREEITAIDCENRKFDDMRRQQPKMLNSEEILGALDKLINGFDDLPSASKQRFLKSIVTGVTAKKDELVIRLRNPQVFDFRKDSEAVPVGANGSFTDKNGSGGET